MRLLSSKNLKYMVYLLSVTILILAVFNVFITLNIHKKLEKVSSKHGRWPVGAYIYDRSIGFDFAPDISGPIGNGNFYVKSHDLGYRIGENEDPHSFQPGGLMSLGCSFTYGDGVSSQETFTQVAADSLHIPAYNYGICSFSYTHALLKAEKLKEEGVLDKLKPKYVVLGCWKGLLNRSRSPFPPLASNQIPLPAAYLAKEGTQTEIRHPLNIQGVFNLIALYRDKGPRLTFQKFFRVFFAAPRIVYLYVANNRMAKKFRSGENRNKPSDYEVYDFYFSGIEKVFSDYGSRIIVLYMPYTANDHPDDALIKALQNHPGIILADGSGGIRKDGISTRSYVNIHPKADAHAAYAEEIVDAIR